jgi:membrane protein DedA with SNARE-associated domain
MTAAVAQLGPLGIFLLMVPESACVPLPSEVTLLSAGFGVNQGWFSFPAAVAAATAGNLLGSSIAYWLGRRGLLNKLPRGGGTAVARCERLLEGRGKNTVFLARLLPLARTFISLPAGHVRVPFRPFIFLTTLGCAIWSGGFVLAGDVAGSAWEQVATTAGRVSLALVLLTLVMTPVISKRVSRA